MEWLKIDLWAWLCLTNTAKLSESKYLGDILGPETLRIVLPYYMVLRYGYASRVSIFRLHNHRNSEVWFSTM